MLTRRMLLKGLSLLPLTTSAHAAQWPSATPIRLLVPFPPGGSVDAVSRLIAPGLQIRLGTTVLVENVGGASGSIGTAAVARAEPNGNTWLVVFDTHAVNPFLIPDLPYDAQKDLLPVFLLGTAPYVLATHPSRPYKSLSDIIEAARKTPETLTYASVGAGSLGNLAMVRLSNDAGVKLIHVPYKGGGPAVADALGGQVDMIIGSAALLTPHLKAEKLRPLVQTSKERLPGFIDVPTAIEAGFPAMECYAWWGIFAPKATPQPIIDRFVHDLEDVLKDDGVSKHLTEAQQMRLVKGGPAVLKAFVEEQMEIWGKVIKENNIKINS